MPTKRTEDIIEAHKKRAEKLRELEIKRIERANKKYTCTKSVPHIKKELKKRIKEGKCERECMKEIIEDIKLVEKNCGKKAAEKFEKDIGMKPKFEDNIKLKF